MKNLAGPYIRYNMHKDNSISYGRKSLADSRIFTVWKNENYSSKWYAVGFNDDLFSSKEAAMNALDKKLIEDGWIILDQEKWESLKVLV